MHEGLNSVQLHSLWRIQLHCGLPGRFQNKVAVHPTPLAQALGDHGDSHVRFPLEQLLKFNHKLLIRHQRNV